MKTWLIRKNIIFKWYQWQCFYGSDIQIIRVPHNFDHIFFFTIQTSQYFFIYWRVNSLKKKKLFCRHLASEITKTHVSNNFKKKENECTYLVVTAQAGHCIATWIFLHIFLVYINTCEEAAHNFIQIIRIQFYFSTKCIFILYRLLRMNGGFLF